MGHKVYVTLGVLIQKHSYLPVAAMQHYKLTLEYPEATEKNFKMQDMGK